MKLPNNDIRVKLDAIITENDNDEANIIPMLLAAQDLDPFNYISPIVGTYIAYRLDITQAKVSSTISFYSALSSKPRGEHVIKLCRSTTCLVNNYQSVRDILERVLNIKMGEVTNDSKFSLEYTECIGACDTSPAFKIGHKVYGKLNESEIIDLINYYREV